MSVVTKIDLSEMPEITTSRKPTEEGNAIRALQAGEAVKFPCRWKHGKGCSGVIVAYSSVRSTGFKVSATCREGTVYVIRR